MMMMIDDYEWNCRARHKYCNPQTRCDRQADGHANTMLTVSRRVSIASRTRKNKTLLRAEKLSRGCLTNSLRLSTPNSATL